MNSLARALQILTGANLLVCGKEMAIKFLKLGLGVYKEKLIKMETPAKCSNGLFSNKVSAFLSQHIFPRLKVRPKIIF